MSRATDPDPRPRPALSRRALLSGGVITAGVGAAAGLGVDRALAAGERAGLAAAIEESQWRNGQETTAFHGVHQAGIEMAPQAHQSLVALALRPGVDRDAIRRLLRVLSDDAARLTAGAEALADSEPELAQVPARLTVTFGVGPALVDLVAPGQRPPWLEPLPSFGVDRLEDRWSGGDLLLQIASDDALTVAHTQRMLLKDSRSFAVPAWVQPGFRRAHGSEQAGATPRNLLGQLDGTVNPAPGTDDFASVVWRGPEPNPEWLEGGTGLVIRRIRMHLDSWDRLDRTGREQAVGRRLDSGAPLTGQAELDEPDFEATSPLGFPVIAEFAHIRRARSVDPHERMVRRSYNYDALPDGPEISDSGLIFGAFTHNVSTQFVPVQQRLDELDLLNEWITPVGSAVFAIPPGCAEGGFVGETLFQG